eukprot:CAMPEP_0113944040 /NCGR_PEP_ID=MMETSP1339-20121228/30602_1 /TAXON_ID=94617 /ORGANISM="Fibrocapsa japonica" /LENGTH=194 /DNA_ID=CAMNT_0000949099 /DNA_START=66 /DNA_END=650 /DNA_ORIENTATION=- /assembly_acc=CAM_ASM_000762
MVKDSEGGGSKNVDVDSSLDEMQTKMFKFRNDTACFNEMWRGALRKGCLVLIAFSMYRAYKTISGIQALAEESGQGAFSSLLHEASEGKLDLSGAVNGFFLQDFIGHRRPEGNLSLSFWFSALISAGQMAIWTMMPPNLMIGGETVQKHKVFPVAALFFLFCYTSHVFMEFSYRKAELNAGETTRVAKAIKKNE